MRKHFRLFVFIFGGILTIIFLYVAGVPDQFFAQILKDGDYAFNIVDKRNSLGGYFPSDLVDLSLLGAPGKSIRRVAYEDLRLLLADAKSRGLQIRVLSAYRSFGRQKFIFSFWSRLYRNAQRFSAEAGHSEHQLGTVLDLGGGDPRTDLRQTFSDTEEGKWLEENAWRYGFALSYPKEKEALTGFIYEPWHYRFIGTEAAREWHDSGSTLREYLLEKPQFFKE